MNKFSVRQLSIVDSLIKTGSRAKTAQDIGVTQATISYSLKQVYKVYPHELFRKESKVLMPTPEALKLQEQYQDLMQTQNSKQELLLSCDAIIEHVLIHYLYKLQKEIIPKFITAESDAEKRIMKLRNKVIDLDIGSALPNDTSIVSTPFLESAICILAREGHPITEGQVTMEQWLKCGHVRWKSDIEQISSFVPDLDVDAPFMRDRKIRYESHNLLSLALICSRSDYIMLIPEVFIKPLKSFYKITGINLPDEISMSFKCFAHYHRSRKEKVASLSLKHVMRYWDEI
ncbi:LysR family transcriptional regulator [Scandinavium sp. NPDC088450]|uniref:LysR family transcriptional regulator n=1 Tax=Scandinavium sp. NPDC088450 TaxID=3364514 RepID=UPI00384AD9D1